MRSPRRTIVLAALFAIMLTDACAHGQAVRQKKPAIQRSYSGDADLSLRFKLDGQTRIHLYLGEKPASWDAIRSALATVFSCPAETFATPQPDANQHLGFLGRLGRSEELDQQVEAQMALWRERQLEAGCGSAMQIDGLVRSGEFQLQPLLAALKAQEVNELSVTVEVPDAPTRANSRQNLTFAEDSSLQYSYSTADEHVAPIGITFGADRRTLILMGSVLGLYMFVPLIVVLRARRSALRAADPVAARFGYFQVVNASILVPLFLWCFTGLNCRDRLVQLGGLLGYDGRWIGALWFLMAALLPPVFMWIVSALLSYRVYVQVRGAEWTRREFLLHQFAQFAAAALPFALLLLGLLRFAENPTSTLALCVAAYLVAFFGQRLLVRVNRPGILAVTAGELRDRMFALAARAGVALKQIYVVSTGKIPVANAFASSGNNVTFTDHMIRRLTRREVDAIAAHEMTHLRLGHPAKLKWGLIGVVCVPMFTTQVKGVIALFVSTILALAGSGGDNLPNTVGSFYFGAIAKLIDGVFLFAAIAIYYSIRRRFEYAADAGSVRLTCDPESYITALLKVSRFNRMPVRWSGAGGALLTHPSTWKRLLRIAQLAAIPESRLQQLAEHVSREAEALPGTNVSDEYYSVPSEGQSGVKKIQSNPFKALWLRWRSTVLQMSAVLATAWFLRHVPLTRLHFPPVWLYAALILTLPVLDYLEGRAFTYRHMKRKKLRTLADAAARGLNAGELRAVVVGFAPAPCPRLYLNGHEWDLGLLIFTRDRLVFSGGQVQFSLTREQIAGLELGQGAPGWGPTQRPYIHWRDAQSGREGVFNLRSYELPLFTRMSTQTASSTKN